VPAGTGGASRHALVIDDEPAIRALLSRLLANRDYSVTEARSFAEVQTVSGLRQFDLVLCDLRLSDARGTDCLRHLRQAQAGIDRRFVFMTGDVTALDSADPADAVSGLAVLSKPFSASDLDLVLGRVAATA
jgi:CheY-like chemotaxis protein